MALDPVTAALNAVAEACRLGAAFIEGMNEAEKREFYADVQKNREFWAGIGAQFLAVLNPDNWPKAKKG